jgi:protoheme IX farnesyltransferase
LDLSYTQTKINHISSFVLVIKPRETLLLAFIGICASLIASSWTLQPQKFLLLIFALTLGSAGCNGLTNYLDRHIDALMQRTRSRVLPGGLIQPAERVLLLIIPVILIALLLAWMLSPICFIFGMVGVMASALWRKTITCTFFGIIAGCSPVLIGWFAFTTEFNFTILLICIMVALWIPVHVWSVIVAKKEEYNAAGLAYFPINLSTRRIIAAIFVMTCLLLVVSMLMYIFRLFGPIYLLPAMVLGGVMFAATLRLMMNRSPALSWKVYKLSSFPYLGICFIAMACDKLFS